MKTAFRVVNEDMSTYNHKEVIDEFDTLDEAIQCSIDNYFFLTTIDKWVVFGWKLVAVNGELIIQ